MTTRGYSARGFPSTYDDQAADAPVAFPIGYEAYTSTFLEKRLQAIQRFLKGVINTSNVAIPSFPIIQALNCVIRSCITEKVWSPPQGYSP